jgi:outer membrane lipoprotein-sorting protein
MKAGSFIALSLTLYFMSGCSGLVIDQPPKPKNLIEIQTLLSELTDRNHSLKSFKGIGKVTVNRAGSEYSARLAWAGTQPDKLRIELFGAPGQPKAGFASDGKWLYYFDPSDTQHAIRKISSKDSSLRKFIYIPITSREIVTLLSGRIPDFAHYSFNLRKSHQGYILILNKRWWTGVQKIYLDPTKKKVQKIETFQGNSLVYRAEFLEMQTVKEYLVPLNLLISDNNGTFFRLHINRYWANVSVSPEMFQLKPPKVRE